MAGTSRRCSSKRVSKRPDFCQIETVEKWTLWIYIFSRDLVQCKEDVLNPNRIGFFGIVEGNMPNGRIDGAAVFKHGGGNEVSRINWHNDVSVACDVFQDGGIFR